MLESTQRKLSRSTALTGCVSEIETKENDNNFAISNKISQLNSRINSDY